VSTLLGIYWWSIENNGEKGQGFKKTSGRGSRGGGKSTILKKRQRKPSKRRERKEKKVGTLSAEVVEGR